MRTKFKQPLKSSDEPHRNIKEYYDPTPKEIAGIRKGEKEIAQGKYITSTDLKKILKK